MNENEFSTKDLHVAAFLQVKGMLVIRLEKAREPINNYYPIFFVFDDPTECLKLTNSFWTGEEEKVMINAKKYVDTIRELRARMAGTL